MTQRSFSELRCGQPSYEFSIAITTGSAIFTTNGVASLKGRVRSIEAAVDLSSASPGRYVLQVRRPNSEWNSYPHLIAMLCYKVVPANRTYRYRNVLYLLRLYQELTVPPGL